jgi:hypothetical protein
MKIEAVVISCYCLDSSLVDLHLSAPPCGQCPGPVLVSRHPVWLPKDRQYGDCSTREIGMYWNVRVYPSRQKTQSWGFGKLEVNCQNQM